MFKIITLLTLLTLSALAGTWLIEGNPTGTGDSLKLDQTVQQTIKNGHVLVEGRYALQSVSDPSELYSSPTYPEYYDLYGAYDNASYVDTSAGSFQDQSFTIKVYPYGTSPYGLLVSSYYAAISLWDNSSTLFQLQISWSDYGGANMTTEGYYIQIEDGVNTYWIDAGNVTSLQVANFTGWNSGPLVIYSWAPYAVSTGNLTGENYWYLYAKKETGDGVLYSANASYRNDANYYAYWANTLYWDAVEDATSYILYNQSTGYWIETADLMVEDNGDYTLWNYGPIEVNPVSPLVVIGDMFVGSNSNAVAKINGDGQFETDVGTGTSPLKVNSPTLNENLNADLLDGWHASEFATPFSVSQAISAGTLTNIVSLSPRLKVLTNKPNATLTFLETNEIRTASSRIALKLENDGGVIVDGWKEIANQNATSNAFTGTFGSSYKFLYWKTNTLVISSSGLKWSEDEGTTWNDCVGTPSSGGKDIAYNGTYYFYSDGTSIYRSPDLKNWATVPALSFSPGNVVANPSTGTVITMHRYAGGGTYRSTDNGTSWTWVREYQGGTDTPMFYAGNNTFIVGTYGHAVSTNDGVNWTTITYFIDGSDFAYDAKNDRLYRVFSYANPSVWMTDRSTLYSNFTYRGTVTTSQAGNKIRVSPSGALLVGASTNIFTSTDGGLSFSRIDHKAGLSTSTMSGAPVSKGDYWLAMNSSTKWMYKFSTENRVYNTLLPVDYGISVTNTWTDASSMIHTQMFHKGVLIQWTKTIP